MLFGHEKIHLGKPFKGTGPKGFELYGSRIVLDHCGRCRKIIGAWCWYQEDWHYFKR